MPSSYDPEPANALRAKAECPYSFAATMHLRAWPGRSVLLDVSEAVAQDRELMRRNIAWRLVDRAVFAADFRARTYLGVALAYAGPVIAPEPWELLKRFTHTQGAVQLLVEHPTLDALVDRLGAEPNTAERERIMREDLGPWLYAYMPAVSIGATHAIAGVGPRVGEWPIIRGHMGLHHWEYVTHGR